jgi:hypothetical protein
MIELEDPPHASSPTGEIRHGVRQLARDVVTLAELQADLLQVEVRAWLHTAILPAAALALAAAIVALASLPVLLLSLAYFLTDIADLPLAGALLASGGGALLIAIVCGLLAWILFRRSPDAFSRFRVELARNIRWLKQVLSRPATVAGYQSRDSEPSDDSNPGPLRPR